MRLLNRVVWNEGMHLSQHHFQLQARYLEEAAAFQVAALQFEARGFSGLEFDASALLNGTVSLVHARGILPDGMAVNIPEGDPAPEPISLDERFSPTSDRHMVYLAIPPHRPGSANCPAEGEPVDQEPRYRPDVQAVRDEVSGAEEVPVAFARKNLRLLLDGEEAGDSVTIPVALVRRDGSGRFIFDPDFIPPLLQIGASPRLMERLDQLVEILENRGAALSAERASARGQADYGSREVATFWLAHAVHSALPGLRHHLTGRRSHPERLFVEMARLGGALCTFSMDGHPRDLPLYDHDDLAGSFGALDARIRSSLQLFLPQNRLSFPLDATRPLLQTVRIPDRRCFQKAHWFLAVRSALSEGELASAAPRLMKICSAKQIAQLVKEAGHGIGMRHLPSPPPDLAPRLGSVYFALDRAEPSWSSIVETGEVGIYVPAAIPEAELELLVILDG